MANNIDRFCTLLEQGKINRNLLNSWGRSGYSNPLHVIERVATKQNNREFIMITVFIMTVVLFIIESSSGDKPKLDFYLLSFCLMLFLAMFNWCDRYYASWQAKNFLQAIERLEKILELPNGACTGDYGIAELKTLAENIYHRKCQEVDEGKCDESEAKNVISYLRGFKLIQLEEEQTPELA